MYLLYMEGWGCFVGLCRGFVIRTGWLGRLRDTWAEKGVWNLCRKLRKVLTRSLSPVQYHSAPRDLAVALLPDHSVFWTWLNGFGIEQQDDVWHRFKTHSDVSRLFFLFLNPAFHKYISNAPLGAATSARDKIYVTLRWTSISLKFVEGKRQTLGMNSPHHVTQHSGSCFPLGFVILLSTGGNLCFSLPN